MKSKNKSRLNWSERDFMKCKVQYYGLTTSTNSTSKISEELAGILPLD